MHLLSYLHEVSISWAVLFENFRVSTYICQLYLSNNLLWIFHIRYLYLIKISPSLCVLLAHHGCLIGRGAIQVIENKNINIKRSSACTLWSSGWQGVCPSNYSTLCDCHSPGLWGPGYLSHIFITQTPATSSWVPHVFINSAKSSFG